MQPPLFAAHLGLNLLKESELTRANVGVVLAGSLLILSAFATAEVTAASLVAGAAFATVTSDRDSTAEIKNPVVEWCSARFISLVLVQNRSQIEENLWKNFTTQGRRLSKSEIFGKSVA